MSDNINDGLGINERKKPGPKAKNTVERGRTVADTPPAMQENKVASSREEAAHSSGRPARISMNNMKKLELPPGVMEDGYYYRWFQDKEGRISQATAAWYEPVEDEQGGAWVRKSGPFSMHLMRLKQEYRDEDNALKKKRVLATLEEEAAIGAGEYAPDASGRAEGGNSAISRSLKA